MIVSTKKVIDILSLAEIVMCVNQQFGGQIWWRGHSKACFRLHPAVFRPRTNNGGYEYELNINKRFMQKAPALYEKIPENNNWFGWLYLMQHYGLPTRLLDWTESPFVASYFAVNENNCDGVLFALSPYRLNNSKIREYKLLDSTYGFAKEIAHGAFEKSVKSGCNALAVLPELSDKRMIAQLSVFTIHDNKEPLEDYEQSSDFLVKYIIPSKSKKLLKDQLKLVGIRPSSLFPDLEYLSRGIKDIREFKETMKELNQINKNYLRNGEYSCGIKTADNMKFFKPKMYLTKTPFNLSDDIRYIPFSNKQS